MSYAGTDILDASFLVSLLPIPVGIICVIFLLLSISRNVSQQSFIKKPIRSFFSITLILIFLLGVGFNSQILIMREIVEFKLHEQEFHQLISLSQPIFNTPKNAVDCVSYIKLQLAISDILSHQTMYVLDSDNSFWVGLVQGTKEIATDFYYIDGKLPNLGSIVEPCNRALLECYYQIDKHWFLCTSYKNDF